MKIRTEVFIFTILPGIVTLLGYFTPTLKYPLKIIVPLSLTAIYFIVLGIFLQLKLNKALSATSTLNDNYKQSNDEKRLLNIKMENYKGFVHKRRLFLDHELKELGILINEYEGHIKNNYRGHKYQDVRVEAGNIKKRTLEIINKEMRDFDEQLFNVQSNKDN